MSVIIILSIVFGLSELVLLLFKRSRSGLVKTINDKGSLIFLWLIMTICISGGFFLAKYSAWGFINYLLAIAGFLIYLSGLIIRWISIIQLKQRFTVNVAINREHALETEGMYKYLRHPSYFGLFLILIGLAMAMNSLISFIIVVVPVYVGLSYRIYIEEKLLEDEFGEKYINFKATRRKIIPFVY